MPTSVVPYVPPADAVTTTVAPTYPTTTVVCTPTAKNISLAARKSQAIPIPAIGYYSPNGGNSRFTNLTIVAVPAQGTLSINGTPLTNGATVSLANLANIVFTAPSNFSGTTFTYKIVTSCGETATMTVTIAQAVDLATGNCPCTTTV